MWKKWMFILLVMSVVTNLNVYGSWYDSGYIEWKQPDGKSFIARLYGDEFENYMVTQDGYQIVQGVDDWYYYAKLDNRGGFKASHIRVGDKEPPKSAQHLKLSSKRLAEIQELRNNISSSLTASSLSIRSMGFNLAIVLVDFTPNRSNHNYTFQDFDNMLFSSNTYIGYNVHPENEEVLEA